MSVPGGPAGGSARGPARIGLIGAGWRAALFADVMSALPDRVELGAVLTRSESSAAAFGARFGVSAVTDQARFESLGPFEFVIVCVRSEATPDLVRTLVRAGVPVLAETPIAVDREALQRLVAELPLDAPVQLAEQYRFQPQHAARLAVAHSGLLGAPRTAFSSAAHYYHGVSLLRAALGLGFERVRVTAERFSDRVLSSLGRDGWDSAPVVRATERVSARLEFPDRGALALYDFDEEQYFSPIRTRHTSIAGERGEIVDDDVAFLRGAADAVRLTLRRDETGVDGDLEGRFLRRITLGERVLYENPFAPARLSDDEIAIASVLAHMTEYVRGGEAFYGLADAAEDQHLSLLIRQAWQSGAPVEAEPQAWSDAASALARPPA